MSRRGGGDDNVAVARPIAIAPSSSPGPEEGQENLQNTYRACSALIGIRHEEFSLQGKWERELGKGPRVPSVPALSFLGPFIRSPVRFVLNFQPHRREGKVSKKGEGRRGDLLLLYNTQLPQHSSCCPLHTREIERRASELALASNATPPVRSPQPRPRAAPPSSCLPFLGSRGCIWRFRRRGIKSNLGCGVFCIAGHICICKVA